MKHPTAFFSLPIVGYALLAFVGTRAAPPTNNVDAILRSRGIRPRVPDPTKILPPRDLAPLSRYNPDGPPSVEEARYVMLMTRLFSEFFHVLDPQAFSFDLPHLEALLKPEGSVFAGHGLESLLDMFRLSDERGLAAIDRLLAIGAYLREMNVQAEKKYAKAGASQPGYRLAEESIALEHALLEENLRELVAWKNQPGPGKPRT